MVRRVVIEAVLVPECAGRSSKEIQQEILTGIRSGGLIIPWCEKVVKVKVIEKL